MTFLTPTDELRNAIKNHDLEGVINYILEGADIDNVLTGYSILQRAIYNGTPEIVNYILDFNPTVDDPEYNPLNVLVDKQPYIERLIKMGAPINGQSRFNHFTPLHNHVYIPDEKSPEIIKILLEYGSDPNLKDREGDTPLSMLMKLDTEKFINMNNAYNTFKHLIKLFIQYGTNIYHTNNNHMTALEKLQNARISNTSQSKALHSKLTKYLSQFYQYPQLITLVKYEDDIRDFIDLYKRLSLINRQYYSISAPILLQLKDILHLINNPIKRIDVKQITDYIKFIQELKKETDTIRPLVGIHYPVSNSPMSYNIDTLFSSLYL